LRQGSDEIFKIRNRGKISIVIAYNRPIFETDQIQGGLLWDERLEKAQNIILGKEKKIFRTKDPKKEGKFFE